MGIYPFSYYEDVYHGFSTENTKQTNNIAHELITQQFAADCLLTVANSDNEPGIILIWATAVIALFCLISICITQPVTPNEK